MPGLIQATLASLTTSSKLLLVSNDIHGTCRNVCKDNELENDDQAIRSGPGQAHRTELPKCGGRILISVLSTCVENSAGILKSHTTGFVFTLPFDATTTGKTRVLDMS